MVTTTQSRQVAADHESVDSLLSVLRINGGIVIRPRQIDTVPIGAQPMTDREREVLSLVAEGYSNKLFCGSTGAWNCRAHREEPPYIHHVQASGF